jgi:tetratricopeptide (TPR) repeat protein
MGMAYFQSKQYDKAEPLFRKAMEINPNDVNAVNNLGAIYLNQNKYPQAIEVFKKAIAMNPNYVNAYSNLGHCYFQLKQYQATIDILNKSLSLDPKHVNDIPFIALSYQGLGNMEMARRYEAEAKKYYSNFKLE